MHWCHLAFAFVTILTANFGCGSSATSLSSGSVEAKVQSSSSGEEKVDPPNEFGYSKMSIREKDSYQEGIVDALGRNVVQPNDKMLVNGITGKIALVQMERKFLFVPLDQGFVSLEDLESVNGFQYAEPYSCGRALVSVNDLRFYIDSQFENAFNSSFEFAESFHHDRALVKDAGGCRILDTDGKTIAELNYDQVNPKSSWCWQVTKIEKGCIEAAL